MKERVSDVLAATAVYAVMAAAAPIIFGLLGAATAGPAIIIGLGLVAYCIAAVIIVVVSRWMVRRADDRDIPLPLAAWWLGSVVGTIVFYTVIAPVAPADLLHPVVNAATLGMLNAPGSGMSPNMAITINGGVFEPGIPWPLFVIYTAVFWAKKPSSSSLERTAGSRMSDFKFEVQHVL